MLFNARAQNDDDTLANGARYWSNPQICSTCIGKRLNYRRTVHRREASYQRLLSDNEYLPQRECLNLQHCLKHKRTTEPIFLQPKELSVFELILTEILEILDATVSFPLIHGSFKMGNIHLAICIWYCFTVSVPLRVFEIYDGYNKWILVMCSTTSTLQAQYINCVFSRVHIFYLNLGSRV